MPTSCEVKHKCEFHKDKGCLWVDLYFLYSQCEERNKLINEKKPDKKKH